jgi:NAD(P)-dependent dehydrogenase (short-subunit alcohol dehydrogenase family)
MQMHRQERQKKIVIVTGAGSGIGRAVASGLLGAGHTVALLGRREQALEQTRLAGPDPEASRAFVCDVTRPDEVRRVFDAIALQWQRVDLLFNNAGIFPSSRPVDEVTDDEWTDTVSVNLNGMFFCCREAFRLMKRQTPQGGRIINNGSISAHAPRPGSVAYTATKHAVTGLTKTVSLDGRAYGIACGQIDIGNASTELLAQVEDGARHLSGNVKKEPTMHVDNVVQGVLYMAALSPEANVQFMTVMATNMPFIGRG